MDILVAVDGSDESTAALERALDVVDAMDGPVTVAYVVDPSVSNPGDPEPVTGLSDADRRLIVESVEDTERRGLDVLDDVVAVAADRGRTVETELLSGDPVVRSRSSPRARGSTPSTSGTADDPSGPNDWSAASRRVSSNEPGSP